MSAVRTHSVRHHLSNGLGYFPTSSQISALGRKWTFELGQIFLFPYAFGGGYIRLIRRQSLENCELSVRRLLVYLLARGRAPDRALIHINQLRSFVVVAGPTIVFGRRRSHVFANAKITPQNKPFRSLGVLVVRGHPGKLLVYFDQKTNTNRKKANMPLTDVKVRALKGRTEQYKVSDSRRLVLGGGVPNQRRAPDIKVA
jgi:hypothetical protein